jgi:hypothetical protein
LAGGNWSIFSEAIPQVVRAGEKEQQFCRFDEQQPHGRGRGKKLYRSF